MRHLSMQVDHMRRFERVTKLLNKYESGQNVEEIAASFDMSRTTVLRYARQFGLPKRSKQLISDDTRAIIIRKLKAGVPQKDICWQFGVSAGFVSQLGKKHGLARYETDRSGLNRFLGVKE